MFFNWLVLSSADAGSLSLTVRGFLLGLVPTASLLLGLAHIKVGSDQLNSLVDGVVALLQAVLAVVSAVVFLVGLGRKLWTTFKGTNAVINQ